MRCGAVLCCLFVSVLFARFVDSLKASEKGVCVSKHTVTKTRPKTVLVATSKWCGKKRCTVKQTRQQKYSVITNRLVCCKGFVYTSKNDSCAPVCSTGCLNGTCTDPDVCQCTSPLYLDPITKNKCLTPTCAHACVNSNCTVNNTCTCLENFTIYNATHCAPNCTTGYELDSSLTCVPKCQNCSNGHCTAPDMCTCDPGYALDGVCKPLCSSKCVNGVCVAPNTCKCLDGFKLNGTDCIPDCDDCENGNCITPGNCTCNEGYIRQDGICQPVCKNTCVNGYCVAPDTCACDDGFEKKNATVCFQPCGECRPDGTCSRNMTASKPHTVTYKCKGGRRCTKAVKSPPEKPTLVCCDDYEYDESGGFCKPLCLDGCIGGNCTAPNVCSCPPPLIFMVNQCVTPKCDNPCVHGECTGTNTCTCHEGYSLGSDNYTCIPQCTNCTNGICVKPNDCQCNPGYYKNEGKCIPECNNCSNGYCETPNECKCNAKYKMMEETCKPVCKSCDYGDCIAPDTCKCFEGYKKGASTCEPICDSCVHGICVAPNECRCHEGYKPINGVCTPFCRDMCVNGNCSAPNECSCKEGYIQNVTDSFVCYKPCSVCNHGTCNLDGECICEEEFELVNGTCTVLTPVWAGIATTPGLAGLEVSWVVGGAVGLLLVILVIVAINRTWRRRKDLEQEPVDTDKPYNSVAYTLTNTLVRKNTDGPNDPESDDEDTSEALIAQENHMV